MGEVRRFIPSDVNFDPETVAMLGTVFDKTVAALHDSLFQSELLMGDKQFLRLFPEQQGYQFFLIDTPATASPNAVAATKKLPSV